ncbi:hypothetical protein N9L68_02570 [bacterium]|nr:hypothetical protein [bacterium]
MVRTMRGAYAQSSFKLVLLKTGCDPRRAGRGEGCRALRRVARGRPPVHRQHWGDTDDDAEMPAVDEEAGAQASQ